MLESMNKRLYESRSSRTIMLGSEWLNTQSLCRNMLQSIKKRARALLGDLPRFPSLLVTADTLEPQGAFAEAQAQFLQPDSGDVAALAAVLSAKRIGVVAHFYMDPEVQGVLTTAAATWPHIAISGARPSFLMLHRWPCRSSVPVCS